MNKRLFFIIFCFILGALLAIYLGEGKGKQPQAVEKKQPTSAPTSTTVQPSKEVKNESEESVEIGNVPEVADPGEPSSDNTFQALSAEEEEKLKLTNYQAYLRYYVQKQRAEHGLDPYRSPRSDEEKRALIHEALKQRLVEQISGRKPGNP